jgi:hypothetical protein
VNKKPFEEWGCKLIPSSFGVLKGEKRYYRVSFGTAQWHTSDPGKIHKACTVFVQLCAANVGIGLLPCLTQTILTPFQQRESSLLRF